MFYDENYINSYIVKVFDFYNGRINICNPAVLYIEWAELRSSSNAGTTTNPNIVTIYPCVIKRFAKNEYQYFYLILETIIHELYHVDQIIDYLKMAYDLEYLKYIEYAVETQTALYISSHKNEICQEFGLDIQSDLDFYRKLVDHYSMGNTYHRKDYTTHLLCILREILGCSAIFDLDYLFKFISHNINTKTGTICAIINDERIVIQMGNKFAIINDVNNFFYGNYFYGNYRDYTSAKYDISYNEDDSIDIFIEIKANVKNIMCKIIC